MTEYSAEALELASIFDASNFSEDTRRQLKEVGTQPLPEDEEIELSNLISEMGKVYGSAKVCIDETTEVTDQFHVAAFSWSKMLDFWGWFWGLKEDSE